MYKNIVNGVYPTMITPFTADGKVDYEAAKRIVKWYLEHNCDGIFAVCQSSEMFFLSLDERIKLAKTVVEAAEGKIPVVASGHCSDSLDEQIKEITENPASSKLFSTGPASRPENRSPLDCMVKVYITVVAPSSSAAVKMASASCPYIKVSAAKRSAPPSNKPPICTR